MCTQDTICFVWHLPYVLIMFCVHHSQFTREKVHKLDRLLEMGF